MPSYTPNDLSVADFQKLMQGAIAPRPIALASTINAKGEVNLSPFSYFNCFSSNPPILIFSPARRVRDNTTKHTLENVLEVAEVVVNVVCFSIVEQCSLASTEYGDGVNEFIKSGLTEVKSDFIKPPRVKESPVQFECKVIEVKALGDGPGAGNLIICEVLKMHIKDEILDDSGQLIDPNKADLVARLGGAWYGRAMGSSLFQIPKPLQNTGVGFDAIPLSIRTSNVLTGNHLARMANVEKVPDKDFNFDPKSFNGSDRNALHSRIATYIERNELNKAWQLALHEQELL